MKRSLLLAAGALTTCALAVSGCSQALDTDARTAPAAAVSEAATVPGAPILTPPAEAPARTPIPIDTVVPPSMPAPGRPVMAAPFQWRTGPATKKGLGASWRPGCPVGPGSLRAVSLSYWGFDGKVHRGMIVLHQDVARRARAVFATMYQRKFPLRSVLPVSRFPKASDDASMAADNTSAFNCRRAVSAGRPSWSNHAYGRAIDVNPVENPYLFGKKVLPPSGARYRNRSAASPGMIRKDDVIHRKFLAAGFGWGGRWSNPDYQHFER